MVWVSRSKNTRAREMRDLSLSPNPPLNSSLLTWAVAWARSGCVFMIQRLRNCMPGSFCNSLIDF